MKNAISYILGGITILSFLGGGIYAWSKVENKVESTAQAVIKIGQRLDQKIESDNYNILRERLWALEEQYGNDINKIKDTLIKKEIKELREDVELQKEIVREIIKFNKEKPE